MLQVLIVIGIIFVAPILAWLAGEHLGVGRLAGDFVFGHGNLRI